MKKSLVVLCDSTTAHCAFCRGSSGPALADVLGATFEFERETDGRPACKHARPLGWKPEPAPSRGLGDTVAKVIKAVTGGKVKECGGCAKRRAALNKLMPYKKS